MNEGVILTGSSVLVHVFNLDAVPADMHAAWACLSADERTRAERFMFELHRRRFVACRYALRRLLAARLGQSPAQLRFAYGEHGRPALVGAPAGFDFNVSHSHHLAVIALSDSMAVGIDVETVDVARPPGADLAQTVLNTRELASWRRHPEDGRDAQFLTYWTAKEAFVKLSGAGLFIEPQQINVAWADAQTGTDAGVASFGDQSARLTRVALGAGIACTLATWDAVGHVVVEDGT